MSRYQRPPNTSPIFKFDPVGWDLFRPHSGTPQPGALVRKVQPFGCPRNGTMGHCYVESLAGEFHGLVLLASLTKITPAELHAAVSS